MSSEIGKSIEWSKIGHGKRTLNEKARQVWLCIKVLKISETWLSSLHKACEKNHKIFFVLFLSQSINTLMFRNSKQRLLKMSSSITSTTIPSWLDLKEESESTPVGKSLVNEVELRSKGKGSAHVQNRIRQFNSKQEPRIVH